MRVMSHPIVAPELSFPTCSFILYNIGQMNHGQTQCLGTVNSFEPVNGFVILALHIMNLINFLDRFVLIIFFYTSFSFHYFYKSIIYIRMRSLFTVKDLP